MGLNDDLPSPAIALASSLALLVDNLRGCLGAATRQIDKIAVVGPDAEAAITAIRKELADASIVIDHIMDEARKTVIEINGEYEEFA
jgi:hypothetical protein